MGLRGSALNRFRNVVDETLEDCFPCVLVIGDHEVACSGPGGRKRAMMMDAGESPEAKFSFRILKSLLPFDLVIGSPLAWQISTDALAPKSLPLEVEEIQERPHESRLAITCKIRRK